MSSRLQLQLVIDDQLVLTINDPLKTPIIGEFIQVPDDRYGSTGIKEVFVGKILTVYPKLGYPDQPTVVKCECHNI